MHSPSHRILTLSLGYISSVLSIGVIRLPLIAAASGGVSQGYKTTARNITAGTLMGVAGKDNSAEPANSHGKYQLLGLVADKPLLALNDESNQVQIVVSGTSNALLSDLNGAIKAGDRIAASPITGVGMKATEAGQVVGIAQKDLDITQSSSEQVKDNDGTRQTVHIGSVPLQVSVSYFAGSNQGALSSVLPPFILQTANGIAGTQVSPVRVLSALLILIFGFIIAGIMLQTAIRSGMISLGRNPLARTALRRELIDIITTSAGILLLSIVIICILLKI